MKPDRARVLAAIDRNFFEADCAIMKLAACEALLDTACGAAASGFFAVARDALYNDMLAGAIRIFDDHKEAGSLWYIVRCHAAAARAAAQACGIDIEELRKIIPRLRHVRDKTHFHIDRRALDQPASVWSDAGLDGEVLRDALRQAAVLLAQIRHAVYGGERARLTPYDGSDVSRIVAAWLAEGGR